MNRKKTVLMVFMILGAFANSFAQDFSLYQKQWHISGNDTLPYRLLLPENFDPSKSYPLVFFMHGAGERGNNNEAQLTHGGKLFLREDVRRDYPAIVVFPQCPRTSYWSNANIQLDTAGKRVFVFKAAGEPSLAMKLAQELLQKTLKTYKIKDDQVYVAGLSMGGMGTFEMVYRNPTLFAAAIPICGGSDPTIAPLVKNVDWWVFHGAKDDIVPPVNSNIMVEALKKAGASVKYTLYPEANHNSWDPTFAEKDLLPWLLSRKKKDNGR